MPVTWLTEDEMTSEMRRDIDFTLRSDIYRAERDANFSPSGVSSARGPGRQNQARYSYG